MPVGTKNEDNHELNLLLDGKQVINRIGYDFVVNCEEQHNIENKGGFTFSHIIFSSTWSKPWTTVIKETRVQVSSIVLGLL